MKFFNIILIFTLILIDTSNSTFQTTIFSEINKNSKNDNILISPLSIFQVLSLTTNGAQTTTQKEMLQVLLSQQEDRKISIDNLNEINTQILEKASTFTTVEIANAVMTRITPLPSFIESAEIYNAPVEALESAEQVNNWCSEKTHGKIPEIIEELSPLTVMILINAVYFKGQWKYQFNKTDTSPMKFYNFNKKEEATEVDTMFLKGSLNYYEDEEIQVVELPYKTDSMKALIILPKEEVSFDDYINQGKLDDEKYKRIVKYVMEATVSLYLPKLKIEFKDSLIDTLKNMGMKEAFSSSADFNGIAKDSDLYISEVLHKTYLSIDEEGTEAAAVTEVEMRNGIVEKVLMEVNRPFIFLLRNSELPQNNDILFISKVEKIN